VTRFICLSVAEDSLTCSSMYAYFLIYLHCQQRQREKEA